MYDFLTVEDVLEIHREQIELYGGSLGVRDLGILESAIAQPSATFQNEYLHKTIYEMAAAYLFHLVKNHPFIDGNKRAALATAMIFLDLNKIEITTTDSELVTLVLDCIANRIGKQEIAAFFSSATKHH